MTSFRAADPRAAAPLAMSAAGLLLLGTAVIGSESGGSPQPVPAPAVQLTGGAKAKPGLEAAVSTENGCTEWASSLPALVAVTGLSPGAVSPVASVCLTNATPRPGAVDLQVVDLEDVDVDCGLDELLVDTTCGSNRKGELVGSLQQMVSVDTDCSGGGNPTWRPLRELEDEALALTPSLESGQVLCVHLQVRYSPADETAAVRAQSDRAGWTYVFGLTAG